VGVPPIRSPRVVVLGGGLAGLSAAARLCARGGLDVVVVEAAPAVGGMSASFELEGVPCDLGSHRLHPAAPPAVLGELRRLIGDDLVEVPRRSRVRVAGRWVGFPLSAVDLVRSLPPRVLAGVARDVLRAPRARAAAESFEAELNARVGPTLARALYTPMATKVWGQPPSALDVELARRRVSVRSRAGLLARALRAQPGTFLHPRRGFGQIADALRDDVRARGGRVALSERAVGLRRADLGGFVVEVDGPRGARSRPADVVISSLPLSTLTRVADAPADVRRAADALPLRSLTLVYLAFEGAEVTTYDAHYLPGDDVPFSRVSEPRRYGVSAPGDRTVLCVELPCARDDATFRAPDEELVARVRAGLQGVGLLPAARQVGSRVLRLPAAWPVYTHGWRSERERVERWLEQIPGLLSLGRGGLFAHDNSHHAISEGWAAARAVRSDGAIDARRWRWARRGFEQHVIED
jgi:protoporphyrinogen oxidase